MPRTMRVLARTMRAAARVKVLPPGALGAASLLHDGVNDKTDCGGDASLAFAGAFTLIGWVLVPRTPQNYGGMVGRGNGAGSAGYGCFYRTTTGMWDWWVGTYNTRYARFQIPPCKWCVVALQTDGANEIAHVDGVKTTGIVWTGTGDPGTNFRFGIEDAGAAYGAVRLANWWAYGRALSDAEVAAFRRNEAIDSTSVVSHWLMEEGAGASVADTIGPNTGTITGATWSSTITPYKARTMRAAARVMVP